MRLVVLDAIGPERRKLGVVKPNLVSGKWTLTLSDFVDADLAQVRPILERCNPQVVKSVPEGSADDTPVLAAIAWELGAAGYLTEAIADGDRQFDFQVDLSTGTMVGVSTPLHGFAKEDPAHTQKVFNSLKDAMLQFGPELAAKLNILLDQKQVDAALQELEQAYERGIFSMPPSGELLNSLVRIDLELIPEKKRRLLREMKVTLAAQLGKYSASVSDAKSLLAEVSGTDVERMAALTQAVALGAIQIGRRESGLSMLESAQKSIAEASAEIRAWTWRNIANSLAGNGGATADAAQAARFSSDAFLQNGDKEEASKSLLLRADLLLLIDPKSALSSLGEMVNLLSNPRTLLERRARAGALYSRGNRLSRLGKHANALKDAVEATELLRGLLGAEPQFVSGLHLASQEANFLGKQSESEAFESEARRITDGARFQHFALAERAVQLAGQFDPQEARAVKQEADSAGLREISWNVQVIQAMQDPALPDSERLEMLEAVLAIMETLKVPQHGKFPAHLALGQLLARGGKYAYAEKWFRLATATDPYHAAAQQFLMDTLWKQEKWREAAMYAETQLTLKGFLPGLTFALAKSQFNAGDTDKAATTLTVLLQKVGRDSDLGKLVDELREQALTQGGRVIEPRQTERDVITTQDLEEALSRFKKTIESSTRMEFWRSNGPGRHKWREQPERFAQSHLDQSLRAKFGDRIKVFKELGAGAGRVDLYLQLGGQLAVVVELKMCGGGYSTPYAASGADQITHYMNNIDSNLGYLIVFDARVRDNGKALFRESCSQHTVREVLIDVRNKVRPSESD